MVDKQIFLHSKDINTVNNDIWGLLKVPWDIQWKLSDNMHCLKEIHRVHIFLCYYITGTYVDLNAKYLKNEIMRKQLLLLC